MSIIGNEALAGASGQAGYFIDRSLRFRSSATAYLSRTPASASNRKTWTWSAWVKRGKLSANQTLFTAGNGTYDSRTEIILDANDYLYMASDHRSTGGTWYGFNTLARFRDPSAWYHIVVIWDTTQSTDTNRLKGYINNIQYTFNVQNVWMSQNFDGYVNSTSNHYIGKTNHNGVTQWLDGYLTEINFIDGQALDPSYFGETDTDTGVWKPKKYTGTYGTNGFYLNFSDNTSTTTLGYDQSSNSNNWTTNNISLTAGSTYDSMQDVPTLTDADAGNYATLNPIDKNGMTLEQANLLAQSSGATWKSTRSTMGMSSGKWYCEFEGAGGNLPFDCMIGVGSSDLNIASYGEWTGANPSVIYSAGDGSKWLNGSNSSYGSSYTIGDIIGVAFDADARTVTFYKNNVSQGQISTGWSAGTFSFEISLYGRGGGTTSAWFNAGQRPFAYTPPTGYKALNTYNLPDPTIADGSDYFGVGLWTGDGVNGRNIPNLYNFTPDAVWIKNRSAAIDHNFADVLRTWKELYPNLTNAEGSQQMNAPVNNGLSGLPNANGYNVNTNAYVSWVWKANGSGVSNTDGSITSTVSANTSSGFSIATYTGDGSNANRTVGHGLGVAPEMVIVKTRSEAARNWLIWHKDLTNYDYALLFTIDAQAGLRFGPSAPTSSVFGVYGGQGNRGTETFVSYCFAAIEGFSAFGKYTGNGSADGPFIYTGFRPAYILIKRSDSAADWYLYDSSRGPYNEDKAYLNPNSNGAENASLAGHDLLSNGFKVRTSITSQNVNGGTYIYAAFAENPFKYSLAR